MRPHPRCAAPHTPSAGSSWGPGHPGLGRAQEIPLGESGGEATYAISALQQDVKDSRHFLSTEALCQGPRECKA